MLTVKLEQSRRANRLLSGQIGTTMVTSSSSDDEDKLVANYDEVSEPFLPGSDQQDGEFIAQHTFKTNVILNFL